eukprot:CAMPEP_0194253606 /NCGR_PEP_ID=MMETSP0158-20130606/30218_1 /TAXON_ID=33649 /ORGANISM="Thalassionema nitzschioides, Strain L26-B" /LENGTH=91 /DNA_ID=CAMNT_0038991359 /DNA_START=137 /DNA_END=412 /DNA_ORIENTATION=+
MDRGYENRLDAANGAARYELRSLGYNATLDMPQCFFIEEILAQYPQAKVLLTLWSDPEAWHRSASRWWPLIELMSRRPLIWFSAIRDRVVL